MSEASSNLERIDFWTELIGPYLDTYTIDRLTYFKIGKKTLVFESNSKETMILRNQLKNDLVNQIVGILRTDYPEAPLIVRIIKEEE